MRRKRNPYVIAEGIAKVIWRLILLAVLVALMLAATRALTPQYGVWAFPALVGMLTVSIIVVAALFAFLLLAGEAWDAAKHRWKPARSTTDSTDGSAS